MARTPPSSFAYPSFSGLFDRSMSDVQVLNAAMDLGISPLAEHQGECLWGLACKASSVEPLQAIWVRLSDAERRFALLNIPGTPKESTFEVALKHAALSVVDFLLTERGSMDLTTSPIDGWGLLLKVLRPSPNSNEDMGVKRSIKDDQDLFKMFMAHGLCNGGEDMSKPYDVALHAIRAGRSGLLDAVLQHHTLPWTPSTLHSSMPWGWNLLTSLAPAKTLKVLLNHGIAPDMTTGIPDTESVQQFRNHYIREPFRQHALGASYVDLPALLMTDPACRALLVEHERQTLLKQNATEHPDQERSPLLSTNARSRL